MKRLLSVLCILTLTASMLAIAVSASADGASWGDVPLTLEEITIDGLRDEAIWDEGLTVAVDPTGTKTSGTITYLHDGDYIYAICEVVDSYILPITDDRETSSWQEDGVEVTFDTKNDGSTRYKVTVNYDGWVGPSGTPEAKEEIGEMFEVAVTETDDGYIAEVKFELNNGAKTGSKIGVNYLVNELDKDAKRTILRTSSKLGATENEVTKFDYIVLSDNEVYIEEEVVEEAPAGEATTAAKTADPIAILACVSLVSALGSMVALKRKDD